MVKLYKSKRGQFVLTLPVAIARAKGFRDRQDLEWVLDNLGNLILRPMA